MVALVVPFILVLTGCSQIQEVQSQVDNIRWCSDVLRLASAVSTSNAEAARNLVDALERSAPADLEADVEVVRSKVEEIEAGDATPTDLPSDDVNDAVGRMVDAVGERCQGEVDQELSNS
ncbi:hypothetical protein [Demequina sp.]|uniref:hypothetical protein n=1 Tax=Demequina sp. TaxID=2050685 RepID=UPI0025CFF0BA|nr:hypothetical protein [Demequina sp.]